MQACPVRDKGAGSERWGIQTSTAMEGSGVTAVKRKQGNMEWNWGCLPDRGGEEA